MAPTEIGTHDPFHLERHLRWCPVPGGLSSPVPDLGVVGTWVLGSSKIAPGPTRQRRSALVCLWRAVLGRHLKKK